MKVRSSLIRLTADDPAGRACAGRRRPGTAAPTPRAMRRRCRRGCAGRRRRRRHRPRPRSRARAASDRPAGRTGGRRRAGRRRCRGSGCPGCRRAACRRSCGRITPSGVERAATRGAVTGDHLADRGQERPLEVALLVGLEEDGRGALVGRQRRVRDRVEPRAVGRDQRDVGDADRHVLDLDRRGQRRLRRSGRCVEVVAGARCGAARPAARGSS